MGTGLKPEIHNACYPEWLKRNANQFNVNHALLLTLQPLYERKIQNHVNRNCGSILCYNDIDVTQCHDYSGLRSLNSLREHWCLTPEQYSAVRQTPDNLLGETGRGGAIIHHPSYLHSIPHLPWRTLAPAVGGVLTRSDYGSTHNLALGSKCNT